MIEAVENAAATYLVASRGLIDAMRTYASLCLPYFEEDAQALLDLICEFEAELTTLSTPDAIEDWACRDDNALRWNLKLRVQEQVLSTLLGAQLKALL